jgi:hypothetical protein
MIGIMTPATLLPEQSYYAPLDAWAERVKAQIIMASAHGLYVLGFVCIGVWWFG